MLLLSRPSRSLWLPLICAALCLGFALPAGAVLIDSGDGSGNTSAPPDDPGWDYVTVSAGVSAVYLGNGWVVTANHVAAGDVVLGGITYPDVPGSKIQISDGMGTFADIAVFRIDPYPAWPLLPISSDSNIVDEQVIMIGQGRDRGASQSACVPPKNGYLWAGTQTKRWGENVVDAYATVLDTSSFYTEFSKTGLTHEAQAANGDSGGGVFVKNGSSWELAGLMFAIAGFSCQPANSSFHGNLTYISNLAAYRDEILPIVRPQCSDELDNDGDLLLDYPDDPECTSEFDDSEAPPKVPSLSHVGRAALTALVFGALSLVRRRRAR
jgi:hypothetical protein